MSNHRQRAEFVTFSNLLPKIIYEKKWQKKFDIYRIFRIWDSVVGPEIAAHAQPSVIYGRILWLAVSDSGWMQHLNYQKYHLLQSINAELEPEFIEDIRYRPAEEYNQPTANKKPTKIAIDPEKRKKFEELLAGVNNQEAKMALHKLWLAQASREEAM